MRFMLALGLLAAAPVAAHAADAPAAAAPAAGHYTTADTDIGTLLDDPASKAIIDKHLPGFSSNGQIEMARGMTLRAIQAFSADQLTDEVLGKIDADLAKLPAKH